MTSASSRSTSPPNRLNERDGEQGEPVDSRREDEEPRRADDLRLGPEHGHAALDAERHGQEWPVGGEPVEARHARRHTAELFQKTRRPEREVRGVELRRVIFIRPDHAPGAYDWVHRFGRHERLQQRVILPDRADVMRLSFVVVDERWSILSVPGDAAVDGEGYAGRYLLRHLLAIEDAEIAEAFTEVHRQLWRRATVVDEALFAGLPRPPEPGDE